MSQGRLPNLRLVSDAATAGPDRQPGRITHDARGNAIWDWAVSTGVLARKTVAELLTTLDQPGALSLDTEPRAANDWSGDPYNRSTR
ncbi:MAG TPA: hypothetical protein VMT29_19430 [Steroidobacteraceae bacterium]|nr:hypothetical protein [Steroidobacteraceae bacterium]